MTRPILVLGTTAYTEVFMDMFETNPGVIFAACVENLDRSRCEGTLAGLPVLWFEEVDDLRQTHDLISSLATTRRADWIATMEQRGHRFATLVHPSSVVSRRTGLGEGSSVDAGCVIAGFSEIGPHVRIGRCASIGHHTQVGRCSTVHPGVTVAGQCRIGTQVTLGMGAVVLDGITIGDGAVIAAGSVVTRDVAARSLVAGNPATERHPRYGPR